MINEEMNDQQLTNQSTDQINDLILKCSTKHAIVCYLSSLIPLLVEEKVLDKKFKKQLTEKCHNLTLNLINLKQNKEYRLNLFNRRFQSSVHRVKINQESNFDLYISHADKLQIIDTLISSMSHVVFYSDSITIEKRIKMVLQNYKIINLLLSRSIRKLKMIDDSSIQDKSNELNPLSASKSKKRKMTDQQVLELEKQYKKIKIQSDEKIKLDWKVSVKFQNSLELFGDLTYDLANFNFVCSEVDSSFAPNIIKDFVQFESKLSSFLHANWLFHRKNWLDRVNKAVYANDFSSVLSILESSIKPIVFKAIWNESPDLLLEQTTFYCKESNEQLNFSNKQANIYELESNGWIWRSSTRVHHKQRNQIQVLRIDELTDFEKLKVENTETIDVESNIKLDRSKRIFYPKRFDKQSYPNLKLIDGLLARRIKLNNTFELLNKNCVAPAYLFSVNENNEIQSKLNEKRPLVFGQLPPLSKFVTRSDKKSIFVLSNYELRKLSRSAGLKKVSHFSYEAKNNSNTWPFNLSPQPSLRTCLMYLNSQLNISHRLECVSTLFKIMRQCIKWNDLDFEQNSPLNQIETRELLIRKDLLPFEIRSSYLVRTITTPNEPVRRTSLRKRKNDDNELLNSKDTEFWIPEEQLKLWEINKFSQKLKEQNEKLKKRQEYYKNFEKCFKLDEDKDEKRLLNESKLNDEFSRSTQQNDSNQKKDERFALITAEDGRKFMIKLGFLLDKKVGEQISFKVVGSNLIEKAVITHICTNKKV